MELPCANGELCMQAEELGVGWLGAGQLSTAYSAQKQPPPAPLPFPLRTSYQPRWRREWRGPLDSGMIALACFRGVSGY